MEWGCMQALIDFDGWRTWKDFAEQEQETSKSGAGKTKVKKPRSSLSAAA
jgi:osomolarity two-component system response regulator SSK1